MPIYEYRCSQCGHELEALQKFSEAPLTACPACRSTALVKQMSAAGFHLKGSGWYATDFRGSKAGKPAESGEAKTDAKPAGDKPAETKSETKAASSPTKDGSASATPITES